MERNYAAAIVLSLVEINPLLQRVPDDDWRRWAGFNQTAIVLGIVERLLFISDK